MCNTNDIFSNINDIMINISKIIGNRNSCINKIICILSHGLTMILVILVIVFRIALILY